MDSPSVSIIIPILNAEKTIAECLASIFGQTFSNFEILIQDGGSIDKSVQQIKDIASGDDRLRLFQFEDSGVYDAMNRILPFVKGKWVLFLGADDALYDCNVLKKFIDNVPTKAPVVYGNVEIVGEVQWASNPLMYDGRFDLKKLFKRNICHQSIFYSTNLLTSLDSVYNTRYFMMADWDLNLKLWAREPFYYIGITVAKFKAGGISSGTKVDKEFKKDFICNLYNYFGITIVFKYSISVIRNWFKNKFNGKRWLKY
jgi:glycosyltransferase involved in cell wall biosynthesis